MVKFFGKSQRAKIVRPVPNARKMHVVNEEKKVEEPVVEKKENKRKKSKPAMEERLEKIEEIMGAKAPKRKVRVEKKNTGLIERTEESTVLLTEDNKMVLMD